MRSNYRPWSKFDLNNTIKIKFICDGEWSIEQTIARSRATGCSRSSATPVKGSCRLRSALRGLYRILTSAAAQKANDPGKIGAIVALIDENAVQRGRRRP